MSAPNQIIEPLPPSDDFKPFTMWLKVNEIIKQLNWLLDSIPCNFEDGACRIHNSPQIFISPNPAATRGTPTAYCAVAQAKMKARIENKP